jgi:hypothetical protein
MRFDVDDDLGTSEPVACVSVFEDMIEQCLFECSKGRAEKKKLNSDGKKEKIRIRDNGS